MVLEDEIDRRMKPSLLLSIHSHILLLALESDKT